MPHTGQSLSSRQVRLSCSVLACLRAPGGAGVQEAGKGAGAALQGPQQEGLGPGNWLRIDTASWQRKCCRACDPSPCQYVPSRTLVPDTSFWCMAPPGAGLLTPTQADPQKAHGPTGAYSQWPGSGVWV